MKKFGKFIITSLLVTGFSIGLIYLLTDIAGLWYMSSAILVSVILAVISFTINYLWTWRIKNRELNSMIASRLIKYVMVGGGITLMSWCLLYTLTEFAHLWYMVSLVIVWIVGMAIAFLANNCWTYSKAK
jgi:dolichol-phosphate mannosyltransferase